MYFKIQKEAKSHVAYIINDEKHLADLPFSKEEKDYLLRQIKQEQHCISFNYLVKEAFVVYCKPGNETAQTFETIRKNGAKLQQQLQKIKAKELHIINVSSEEHAAYLLAEGIALANYQFLKYKSDAKKSTHSLTDLTFDRKAISPKELKQLETIIGAVYHARNLINEPLHFLTAEQLSKELVALGKEGRFRVNVWGKSKIEQMKMGGILAVNRGSVLPPTFTIMEHKPAKAFNKTPIVLVGKGIVYDTGGLSLKPTANSMDRMKSDMSGAALVAAVMYVAGTLDLPIHLVGLVPATENRPGVNAYVPGDVITMYSGTTVEVLNTDAEGRLVLADALHYAKKYNPELVMDFATLTGAASVAIGDVGIVCMGTAPERLKEKMKDSGFRQYERLVEYPLWEEYGKMIQSDIADLKNIGGPTGGAITAGKFLEHFTDYPWMHFDIAGVAHHISGKDYRPVGGTGYGVRMIVDFLLNYGK
jgi:leucyl aminopeptidase